MSRRYVTRRVPEHGWCVIDKKTNTKVWPEAPNCWAPRRAMAAVAADELNAPAVRFCVCGGVAGAPDHDHERRMAANYEASQIAIAESVHEQRVAEA